MNSESLAHAYLCAKRFLINHGFAPEIDFHEDLDFDQISESYFLSEAAWIILSSGMREAVVRAKFSLVAHAFQYFGSAAAIVGRQACKKDALRHFNHPGKINAILTIAEALVDEGFASIKDGIQRFGPNYLMRFSYIGPVTCLHLAKNIGFDVVKPDRHLVRLAASVGRSSPVDLCEAIQAETGERVAVIDIVLWRFAVFRSDYLAFFRASCSHKRHSAGKRGRCQGEPGAVSVCK